MRGVVRIERFVSFSISFPTLIFNFSPICNVFNSSLEKIAHAAKAIRKALED